MSTMFIHPYQPEDEQALIQLWISCNLVVAYNNPVRDIQRKLQVNPECLLIGELDGEIVASHTLRSFPYGRSGS